jgi:hypothetical protein
MMRDMEQRDVMMRDMEQRDVMLRNMKKRDAMKRPGPSSSHPCVTASLLPVTRHSSLVTDV